MDSEETRRLTLKPCKLEKEGERREREWKQKYLSGGTNKNHFLNLVAEWLGGSVGYAADVSSGHDLVVCELEPGVRLCAGSSEPGAWSLFRILCLPLSDPPPFMLCLSLSQK